MCEYNGEFSNRLETRARRLLLYDILLVLLLDMQFYLIDTSTINLAAVVERHV